MQKRNRMQDPEFEKIVRQKMEELQFEPQASLWERVGEEIRQEKRSRRPLAWIFLFLGLVLAAGAFYRLKTNFKAPVPWATPSNTADQAASKIKEPKPILPDNPSFQRGPVASGPSGSAEPPAPSNTKGTGGWQKSKTRPGEEKAVGMAFLPPKPSSGISSETKDEVSSSSGLIIAQGPTPEKRAESLSQAKKSTPPARPGDLAKSQNPANIPSNEAGKKPGGPNSANQAGLPALERVSDKRVSKKQYWAYGFTLAPGISNMENGFLRPGSMGNYYSSFAAPGAAGGAVYLDTPSQIQAGFSFVAGVFMQKGFGDRFSIRFGLNYHNYSASIRTGEKMDSNFLANFPIPSGSIRSANVYYPSGRQLSFTNHYQFLEIPLSLQIQINQGRSLSIYWEGGFSLSELIAANALHYDPYSGLYYKDNSLLTKTQLGASTSLLLGIPVSGFLFQAGPVFQYGISQISTDHVGPGQHLIYYGIKLALIRRKNGF
jgi:hypothetical protein